MLVYNNFEQRSPEWYKIREGKITASPILNILGKDTLQTTKDAIENLAMVLAIESVHGMIENDYVSFDMQRGIDLEPFAFNRLESILNESFISLEKVAFIEYSEHIGASPDGYVIGKAIAEIKCPTAENLFKLQLTDKISPKYIAQMQHQMLCSETEKGYFFSFAIHKGREHYYLKEIERDEDTINLIKKRSEIVIEKKLNYIEKLKTQAQ